jgi:hypothetical protein
MSWQRISWLVSDRDNVTEDSHLTTEQKDEKSFIDKAEEALKTRKERRDSFYRCIDAEEEREVREKGITDYNWRCKLWKFCGDIPKKKIWYRTTAADIDNTVGCNFWCWEEDHDIDEDWYTQGPEDFNKTKLLLTPGASERQYGRVFFESVTRYISKDQVVPSSLKQEIKGYYQIGEEKVYGDFQRKKRSDLYYPPKTGITTYGSKEFIYSHTGTGILKLLTFEGQRCHYFLQRIRTLNRIQLTEDRSLDPSHPEGQSSVGGALFAELRSSHFDFNHWTNTYRKVQARDEEFRSNLQKWDAERYQFHNRKLGKAIDRLVLRKIKNSNCVRKVQRKWRSSNWRRTSTRALLATRCQRAWRTHILRSFGTKRTIVGLLGKNIKVECKPPRPVDHTLVYAYVALVLIYISKYF